VKIQIKFWEHECGEPGCCYDWGYDLYIDDVLTLVFGSEEEAYKYVLVEKLGHTVEFE
jgi:hypothetical protein